MFCHIFKRILSFFCYTVDNTLFPGTLLKMYCHNTYCHVIKNILFLIFIVTQLGSRYVKITSDNSIYSYIMWAQTVRSVGIYLLFYATYTAVVYQKNSVLRRANQGSDIMSAATTMNSQYYQFARGTPHVPLAYLSTTGGYHLD